MKQMLKKLLIVTLAVLLAVITPMQVIAAGTSAEEDDEKVKYISELFLVNKENLSKYEGNNAYLVYKTPIYTNTHSDEDENPGTELYLVAELTTDAANAITDIKTMEMGGGYSFELFKQYLNEMRLKCAEEAANLLEGPIAYFRDMYDGEDSEPAILSAYQLLNCFIDDDPDFVDKNKEPARLGDLFASDDLTQEALTDILFMGNTDSVRVIKKALAIACSEDENGKTFLDYMKNTRYVGNFLGKLKLEDYKTEAEQLLASLDEFYEAYNVYAFYADVFDNIGNTGYPATVDDFDNLLLANDFGTNNNAEDFLKNYVEGNIGNDYELFYKGKKYVDLFSRITYSSNSYEGDGTYMVTLLDFLTQSENLNPDTSEKTPDELRLEELEYFAAMLIQQGNGMMLELGLPELVSIAVSEKDEYQKRIAELQEPGENATEEDKEVAQYAKDGISVFYGMDSAIYESGMVAMTTAAQDANANGDTSWAARQQEMNETAKKAKNIYLYSMIGSGALAATAVACFAKYASYTLKNYVPFFANAANELEFSLEAGTTGVTKALFSNSWQAMRWGQTGTVTMIKTSPAVYYKSLLVGEGTTSAEMLQTFKNMGAVRSAGQIAAGVTAGIMVVVSVAVLAFSVYMYVTSDSEILTDAYTEIPAIICDDLSRDKTNETTRERTTEHQYVYYYGVKNPDLKVTKSLYPITGEDEDLPDDVWSLPENKGNVQDIYNWELYGNRKWCCLYTTKDPFAGIPIIADSLKFDGDISVDNYVTVKSFDSTIGKSDLYKAFVECFDELEKTEKIKDASEFTEGKKLFIHYQYDASAAGARDAGETFTGLLGSIVTTPAGWGLMAGVLALGVGGGAVIGNLTAKKKKKDDEGEKEEA